MIIRESRESLGDYFTD